MEVLVIGDSWASARESDTGLDAGWPELLAVDPACRQGVSGATALQWATDHEGWLSRARGTPADAVVVSLFGNDARLALENQGLTVQALEAGLSNLRSVVEAVLRPLTIVMLYADPFGGRDARAQLAVTMMNGAIRDACRGLPVVFADTAHWLGPDHFDGRDIHPTRLGHAALARGLGKLLEAHDPIAVHHHVPAIRRALRLN